MQNAVKISLPGGTVKTRSNIILSLIGFRQLNHNYDIKLIRSCKYFIRRR
jgi:hypothetical protein